MVCHGRVIRREPVRSMLRAPIFSARVVLNGSVPNYFFPIRADRIRGGGLFTPVKEEPDEA